MGKGGNMKIAVIGTGGVGGYYGARLAQSGSDVTFIARGAHLQAIKKKGLQIKSPLGDHTVFPAKVTDKPVEAGPMDLIIFVTKTYQTDEAVEMIRPMIGKDTVIIPLQNGIDAAESIGRAVGMDHMVGGATWMSAAVEEPGVIGHYSQFGRIAFGELNGKETPRLKPIFDAINASGVKVEITDDIQKVLWTKFVFISPISALGCLTRVTMGEYRGVPEARKILLAAVSEVTAVGRAGGVALDADVVEKTMAFIDAGAPGIKPSIQRDVEAGKLSELESMIGSVVRLGELRKVPTPVIGMAYAMLKPRELLAQQAAKT
jgi:2-dehydropantoate 2-reductase